MRLPPPIRGDIEDGQHDHGPVAPDRAQRPPRRRSDRCRQPATSSVPSPQRCPADHATRRAPHRTPAVGHWRERSARTQPALRRSATAQRGPSSSRSPDTRRIPTQAILALVAAVVGSSFTPTQTSPHCASSKARHERRPRPCCTLPRSDFCPVVGQARIPGHRRHVRHDLAADHPWRQSIAGAEIAIYPNEMVPLQIDLAIGERRYLVAGSVDHPARPAQQGRAVRR